jgi:bifunctional DNA-binding transcriptional regulator/antitoxin component of YhaV-PrlF toxin-antitoxin module
VSPTCMLVKALTRMDSGGRILLPANVRRALGLKQQQVLELRTVGRGRSRRLMVLPQSADR